MKRALYIFFLVSYVSLFAQAPKKFYTRFGGYGHEVGYGVIQTLNGQYAVTGSTSSFGNGNTDMYLALVDSMGWVRWEKSFGGFNNDIGRSIIQLKDSGFVMAGYTNSFGSGGYDMYVVRTDKNGNFIWQKTIGGIDWDFAYCVKESNGGDSVIVCGNTYSYGYGKSDGYIVKLDPAGNVMWTKTFGGSEDDEFKSFTLTYNNQYAFAGTTKSMGDVKGDCWMQKISLDGDSIIGIKYGNNFKQFANDIEEHPLNHNLVICGGYDQVGYDSTSAILAGFNENCIFQFQFIHSYHERADEQYVSLKYFKGNQFYYLRKCNNSSTDKKLETLVSNFSDNIYISATKYGSIEDDELFDINKTKDKGFICVGYTKGFNANLSDVFLLKLDSITITGAQNIVNTEEYKNSKSEILIYPTITNNEVNIINFNNDFKNTTVTISNQLGMHIIDFKLNQEITTLQLEYLPEGVYFFNFSNPFSNFTNKVIKLNK